jgi:hypothetical protein
MALLLKGKQIDIPSLLTAMDFTLRVRQSINLHNGLVYNDTTGVGGLGGYLVQDTNIDGNGYDFIFGTSNTTGTGNITLSSTKTNTNETGKLELYPTFAKLSGIIGSNSNILTVNSSTIEARTNAFKLGSVNPTGNSSHELQFIYSDSEVVARLVAYRGASSSNHELRVESDTIKLTDDTGNIIYIKAGLDGVYVPSLTNVNLATDGVGKLIPMISVDWSYVINTPTTIAGYGITDAYTKTESDNRFVNVTGDSMTGFLTLSADPTSALHAATKAYVDAVVNGLNWKHSVTAATTGTLPSYAVSGGNTILTGSVNGALPAQDGVTLSVGNRLLVKNESGGNRVNNGSYEVTVIGDGSNPWQLTRTLDADTATELLGATYYVLNGSVEINRVYSVNVSPITLGSTVITLALIAGPGTYIAGTGIILSSNVFSLDTVYTRTLISATDATGVHYNSTTGVISLSSIPNSSLTNNTISGIALGSNLATLTIGTDLSGTSYNGSTAVTIANTSTLATVTGRGASTSVYSYFNGGASITGLTVEKTGGTSSITFPVGSNDAGFIQHSEVITDSGKMLFSVSDNDDTNDYFAFGNTQGGIFNERFKIYANGTIVAGIWQATAIADAYIASSTTWNNKWDGAVSNTYIPMSNGSHTFSNSLLSQTDANKISLGYGGSAAEYSLQIGNARTGNGYAYVDLIGDATYTDYGARFERNNTGPNATTFIVHRGTGAVGIQTTEAAPVHLGGAYGVTPVYLIMAAGSGAATFNSTVTSAGLKVWDGTTKGTGSVADANVGIQQTIYSSSISSGFSIANYTYAEQTVALSGSIQGVEGQTFSTHSSGNITLMLGVIGNIQINGVGSVTTARSVQGGGNTGVATSISEWLIFNAGISNSGGSAIGTGYSYYAAAWPSGVSTKYSFFAASGAGITYINDGLIVASLSTKGLVTNTAAGVLGTTNGTGFIKNDGSGNISYDNSTYLTTSTADLTYLRLDAANSPVTGELYLSGGIRITSTSHPIAATGQISYNSTYGLYTYGMTGSSNDYTLFSGTGVPTIAIPTGTTNVYMPSTVMVGSPYGGNTGEFLIVQDSLKVSGTGAASIVTVGSSSDSVAGGQHFQMTDTAGSVNSMIYQLSAAGHLDFWGYDSGTWTKTLRLFKHGNAEIYGSAVSINSTATLNQNNYAHYGLFNFSGSGTESSQYILTALGSAISFILSADFTPHNLSKHGAMSATVFKGGSGKYLGIMTGSFSCAEFYESGNVNTYAAYRVIAPVHYSEGSAYTGTITDAIGYMIDDMRGGTDISARITNVYAIKQLGSSDIVYFASSDFRLPNLPNATTAHPVYYDTTTKKLSYG